ncbi:MAG: N-acetylmuramoyl-L-alanine amidase [bacterium]|nr:N-acetylmuramoyl-L-alanine amidase [bacterium]
MVIAKGDQMYRVQFLPGILVLFLFSLATGIQAAQASSVRLVVAGHVNTAAQVEWQGEEVKVRAGDILSPLGINPDISRQGRQMVFTLPDKSRVQLAVGDEVIRINGKPCSLGMAVTGGKGVFIVPLRAFANAIGLNARWNEDKTNIVVTPRIDDINIIHEEKAVKFLFSGHYPLHGDVQSLIRPRRIFMDVKDAVLMGQAREEKIGRSPVVSARVSQNWLDPDVVRLVVDLDGSANYSLDKENDRLALTVDCAASGSKSDPKEPLKNKDQSRGGLSKGDKARIEDIAFERVSDRITRVKITASGPTRHAVMVLQKPDRLVVDLYDAVRPLMPPKFINDGKGPIKRARISQFQLKPAVVRLVLDLNGPTGYRSYEDPDNPDKIIIEVGHTVFSNRIIVLDPGHGGSDPGAIGPSSVRESHVVLDVAARLNTLLQASGAKSLMTRYDDTFISLDGRVIYAEANNADLFVSIHANSMPTGQVTGIETYYCTPQSAGLAQSLHRSMVRNLSSPDRGVRQARFLVIRKSRMPSILLEIGFLSSPEEEALLVSPAYRQRVARAIYDGLEDYFLNSRQAATGVLLQP